MDAYGQSIILPVVGNAEKEISIFNEWVKTGYVEVPKPDWNIERRRQVAEREWCLTSLVSSRRPDL